VQAIYGNPSNNYGVSLAVWDHTVLPSTRHKRTPRLYPSPTGWYSIYRPFKDGGLSKPRPECKDQLAHGCYATARASETRTHDLANASRAR